MKYKEFERKLLAEIPHFSIGKSTLGRDIWACHVGSESGSQILVQAGIHAREYVTCLLATNQAKHLKNAKSPLGVFFVLCSNPDGVAVVLDGFGVLKDSEKVFCEKQKFDRSLFKANANLVDLNTNFDALWGQGESNVRYKNFENFIGQTPESETETKILTQFTKMTSPKLTISYHTKGEVVYYGFDTQSKKSLERDKKLGEKISKSLGFALERSLGSCGGYKDWACDKLDIPSFTIEFGSDNLTHPLGEECLPDLEKSSLTLFDTIATELPLFERS